MAVVVASILFIPFLAVGTIVHEYMELRKMKAQIQRDMERSIF